MKQSGTKTNRAAVPPASLPRRELQLVKLVAQGLSDKEIAAALAISEAMARSSISKLCLRTGARDRYELAIRGLSLAGQCEETL